jgi:TonB-dependent starch-binding outer membrane protein SusC
MRWTSVVALLVLLTVPFGAAAQQTTGTITGVVTGTGGQPLAGASVAVTGTTLGTQTGADGRFTITAVPSGQRNVRATFAGFGESVQQVNVVAAQTVTVNIQLTAQVFQLEELVAVGYGTQRREAITGSVATISAAEGLVGQITAPTEILRGRVPGVYIVQNDGSPGAGANVRIRGGTSISASNEPLYVIDGVPIQNVPTEAPQLGQNNALGRNPLNLINPNDIETITVLKDASATAIYGSRGANGVVLITTRRGAAGRVELTYDTYVAQAQPTKYIGVLTGNEYRTFVQQQIAAGVLPADRANSLGAANTDWEREVLRNALTHNHNLSFSGGSQATQYFGSLSYMNQQGIVRSSGLERLAGRINARQQAFEDRLRLGLNLNASQVRNDYAPTENTGGFTGTIFTNMLVMNPTHPVLLAEPVGNQRFFEIAPGAPTVRNPVAIAEQIDDDGISTRILGNVTADFDVLPSLTAQFNVGTDRSEGSRNAYYPRISPLGATTGGQAIVSQRSNFTTTFQSYLTYRLNRGFNDFDILGGYEFTSFSTRQTTAEARDFITDAFRYYNLGAGAVQEPPSSGRSDSRQASFFTRANYGLMNRYFLTGVLRYDGSSRFGEGNQWAVFPALSASWNIADEPFMANQNLFQQLRFKAGWGLQGSQEINPYVALITLGTGPRAVFGEQTVVGVAPTTNPNPNLKWEETSQWNLGLDYRLAERFSGTLEFYNKRTYDLLLTVAVPQPAPATNRLENVGSMRNRGIEFALDAQTFSRPNLDLVLGLSGSVDRNEVLSLGPSAFIVTGSVSGQGQSGQNSQRLMPGHSVGTFFGPEYVDVDNQGRQLFNRYDVTRDAGGNITSRTLAGTTLTPGGNDFMVIGDANPDFTLNGRGQLRVGDFDASFLLRGVFGNDVLNNTALVYSTKSAVNQDRNFLRSALNDPIGLREPAIYSSRWIEDGSFVRMQNVTVGYTLPAGLYAGGNARVYLSGDNLFILTDYSGYDPEVHTQAGLASRGIDYLNYPNPRTFTAGMRVSF